METYLDTIAAQRLAPKTLYDYRSKIARSDVSRPRYPDPHSSAADSPARAVTTLNRGRCTTSSS
jgi:hypothetical protein